MAEATKKEESHYFVPNVTDNYELTPEAYLEIYEIVNRRRPWSPDDSISESLFPNIADNPTEAAFYEQHRQRYINMYEPQTKKYGG